MSLFLLALVLYVKISCSYLNAVEKKNKRLRFDQTVNFNQKGKKITNSIDLTEQPAKQRHRINSSNLFQTGFQNFCIVLIFFSVVSIIVSGGKKVDNRKN